MIKKLDVARGCSGLKAARSWITAPKVKTSLRGSPPPLFVLKATQK
jgi:hypothetical protein